MVNVEGSGVATTVPLPPLNPLVPLPIEPTVQRVEIVLLFMVTVPVDAKTLPQLSLAPVFSVMLSSARIFPSNVVLLPRVAELPIIPVHTSACRCIAHGDSRAARGR